MRPPSSCCASGGDWEGGQAGGGLIRYLYATGPAQQEGRGRRNRHVDPHLVAGFDDPDQLEPAVNGRGRREFRRLISLLEAPLAAAGVGPDKKPVYHLVIAARKDPQSGELVDRWLADEAWADIAATYLDRLGLARRGEELGCRWVGRCGTPTTMCTWWPRWPARTAGGCSPATTTGGPAKPAAPWRPSMG